MSKPKGVREMDTNLRIDTNLEQISENILIAGIFSGRWTDRPPTEQGWYWHWNGDMEDSPFPLSIMYSGTDEKCFVSIGNNGIDTAINCDEYGGYWQPLVEPNKFIRYNKPKD